MIIYTNEGNPLGLQLLMLAKFAKRSVQVQLVNLNDAKFKDLLILPTLELDDGLRLFSPAAVAKYLLADGGQLRDEWLEWAITLLAPALAHHMAVGHRADPNALPVLNALVKKLDDCLKASPYLAGDKLTAADIAVWSLLAPDGTLKGAQNLDSLQGWYNRVKALPEVQQVLAEQPLKDLSFNALQQSNRYGGLHHVPLKRLSLADSGKLLAETASTVADTVTDAELAAAGAAFTYTAHKDVPQERTVLPKAGERNVLITSALPYVNNVPHLGNIIGCVLSADIFARYSRSAGYNTLLICGTDEYGTATENKALAENLTPREICDKYFELHNSIYRWFGIGFDYFGRTTTQEQTDIVQEAFKDVQKAGYIITDSVEQLLCQKCDRFLADRFVEGTCPHPGCGYEDARGDQCDKCGKLVTATELIRPRCKVCNTAPILRSSDQLFIDLPKAEPRLREWVDKSENGWTHNAKVITRAWLREGLKPRCITRDLKWGIPVPHSGFEKKVFYVWFDAPFGYVSMTKRYTKEYQQWWQPAKGTDVELFQFMAKDNVPFHSVVWPSVLLAINKGHTLVSHIMATEYLNYEDGKFSKSRGIGVFGNDAQETGIPADVWRFYLASARPEGQDSSFSWNDLAARNNSELLNNLGNFVNRALVFCEKNFNSTVPEVVATEEELILLALVNRELRGYINSLEKAKLRDGIRHLLAISRHGNGYMQTQQPWVLLKGSDEQKQRAATIIALCANIACLLANLLFPYMPATARTLFAQLNAKQTPLNAEKPLATVLLPAGHKIGKPAPLFAKLEQSFIDELKGKYGGSQASNTVADVQSQSSAADLEQAVQVQADKVRELKASTKDKAVWQPEVSKLLDLKKQLEEAKKSAVSAPASASAPSNGAQSVQDLEKAVQAQGEKVRNLKGSTKDKSVWQPEVNVLLDLKKQLEAAQKAAKAAPAAAAPPAPSVDADKVKALEEKLNQQAEKVRTLKAAGDVAVWKPELEILLGLKNELAALTGAPPAGGQAKSKGKKKK
ncbi:methionine--tRNA ligase, cytoplasmic [Drosophila guanche]|uniref:Methionine--tRNA ligase, cytoplasmic n=1 Tax=Drosophila guanche TaxID=7266 RepID=A0A3B0JJQ6_DROGU|nr:methionine--tRNA ligase, cytoplasmic [Drosophila guanche]SPP73669.1 blast:Methionine--tRNA ligase%2C cytoplasmic [Drosophila guanche]